MNLAAGRILREGAPATGIAVSDGRTVVRTDARGRFSLPGEGPFVFVVRPAGTDADPWFAPPGPDLRFELRDEAPPACLVQVTDLHLSLGDPSFGPDATDATYVLQDGGMRERIVTTPAVLTALFDEIAAAEPGALVVATGDLTNAGKAEEYEALREVLARAPVRVVPMPGNHDLMPSDPYEHVDGAPHDFTAVPTRYERALGPRWFSFDVPGLHVVAIDWFTHRLGIDPEQQEAWIAADLAATDLPYVLLSHDLMSAGFFERLPRAPLASFSGHWHTSRVMRHAGVSHYNTGPATFGGLDYTPPHYRVVRWAGDAVQVRTVARGPAALAGATFRPGSASGAGDGWITRLDGAAHLAPPVVAGDTVLVASRQEDRAGGALEAFDVADGSLRWRVRLGAAVKAAPTVAGDAVVAIAVTGETVCVELETGRERWRTTLDDPFRLWCYLRPAVDGERVYVGDVARFAALALEDGAEVWAREDLGRRENMTAHAHPSLAAGTLVVSFPAQLPELWGLDPATGATRWPSAARGRSVYEGTPDEVVRSLPRTPMAALTGDPDGEDVYVVRLGSCIERVSAVDGAVRWSTAFTGWFNPGRPAIAGDAVVASASMGSVWCFARADGRLRWRADVADDAPLAFGAYRDRGPALLAGPAVAGDALVIPTGDGDVVALSVADGRELGRVSLGMPVLARAAIADDRAILAGVDGALRAVRLERLGVYDWRGSSLYV